jgi:hypothetical protein
VSWAKIVNANGFAEVVSPIAFVTVIVFALRVDRAGSGSGSGRGHGRGALDRRRSGRDGPCEKRGGCADRHPRPAIDRP